MVRRCQKARGHEPPCNYGPRVDRDATDDPAMCMSFIRAAPVKSPNGQLERDIDEEIARLQPPTTLPPETQELERLAQKLIEEEAVTDPNPTTEAVTPGKQTSEFKLTAVAMIAGAVLEAFAAILHTLQDQGVQAPWMAAVFAVIGVLLQVASLLGYQKTRAAVKVASASK